MLLNLALRFQTDNFVSAALQCKNLFSIKDKGFRKMLVQRNKTKANLWEVWRVSNLGDKLLSNLYYIVGILFLGSHLFIKRENIMAELVLKCAVMCDVDSPALLPL